MENYNNILVSVVMPVYNGALYLREAIDSILSQTHTNLELIIINDGSTDDSEEIIRSYDDPRIRYILNEKNCGICVTLNKGLDVAQGKYIARMDCDDISLPERLQKQVEYIEQNPSIGILGSDIIVFGEGIEEWIFTFEHDKNCCKAGLLFNTCFAHPAVIIRKSLLDGHKLRYDEEYRGLEDFELWYRISRYADLINLSFPLLRYRKHKSQETQNVSLRVVTKLQEFLSDRVSEFVSLRKEELYLIDAYSRCDWGIFNNENIYTLLSIFSRIIKSKPVVQDKGFKRGMQITLSKAIAFAMNNSNNVTISNRRLYSKSLFEGVMPLGYYLKFMYHTFF
jgi:glycosyltransferase involved in cell wall biosynthesis